MAWSKEYPSLKDGGWFWLRDRPTDAPRLTQLCGGYNFYEPLGVVCETTEYLGPVTPADAEQLASLQAAAQAALRCLQGTGDKSIDQVKAQLQSALSPQNKESK